ncbi:MAG: 6-phosphogluconolactonase [Chitinophagaceae bacterium]|nr:MAG: 6-phosphogluconolactonase [Chitinophagaceae bacterium]
MQTLIFNDSDELSRAYAEWLMEKTKTVLAGSDRFTLALSGGSTPKKLYKLLAAEPYKSGIQWSKIHFFWGDERFVPFSDEKNNAKMAFDELLDKVDVRRDQVHIMDTSLHPDASVAHYDEILHRYFDDNTGFDLVMLGLGDNAHTLSLFPWYPIVHDNTSWVSAFFLEEQDMFRISLTKVLVNRSSSITWLVAGADKASSVKAVMEGPANADLYPAQVINNGEREMVWFLDKAAAADLAL